MCPETYSERFHKNENKCMSHGQIVLFLLTAGAVASDSVHFYRYNGRQLDAAVMFQTQVDSDEQCLGLCKKRGDTCKSINVIKNENFLFCKLLRDDQISKNLNSEARSTYYDKNYCGMCKVSSPDSPDSSYCCDCRKIYPKTCNDYKVGNKMAKSGVYKISLSRCETISVFCDMDIDSRYGWTVLQKRFDGSLSFNRSLHEFENGFGNPLGEHWIGLKYMHMLTSPDKGFLYIHVNAFSGESLTTQFHDFVVASSSDKYKVSWQFDGDTPEDELQRHHDGRKFNAYDYNNEHHCATTHQAGWWYREKENDCSRVNLNGKYGEPKNNHGFYWTHFPAGNGGAPLRSSTMMFRMDED